ncbi:MAG: hypothetical protein RJA36_1402 [Pseudomonadota bacterium]|jgi:hypothetical protein
MKLSYQESATILAALRYWQGHMAPDGSPPLDAGHFEFTKPLSSAEINVLCERINCGPDDAIDTSDIPEATEEWFAKAKLRLPEGITPDHIKAIIDNLEAWFDRVHAEYVQLVGDNAVLKADKAELLAALEWIAALPLSHGTNDSLGLSTAKHRAAQTIAKHKEG